MIFEKIPLSVLGISHKTAPVKIREKVALSVDEQYDVLKTLKADDHTLGAIVLSTFNRTEIYFTIKYFSFLTALFARFR